MVRKSKQQFTPTSIRETDNKDILVDELPSFTRVNKFLGDFRVHVKNNLVPNGTRVAVRAFSSKTGEGKIKNNEAVVINGVAKFTDIRFIGRSGRGTCFDLFFIFYSDNEIIARYKNAIKVTVDGPRPPRTQPKFKRKDDFKSSPTTQLLSDGNSDDDVYERSRCDSYASNTSPSTSALISPDSSRPESVNSNIFEVRTNIHNEITQTNIEQIYQISTVPPQDNLMASSTLSEQFSNLNLNSWPAQELSQIELLNSCCVSYLPINVQNFVNFVFSHENTKSLAYYLLFSILSELEKREKN